MYRFPSLGMSRLVIDEANLKSLPVRERLDKCAFIIKNDNDESLRWDAVWVAGEIAESLKHDDPLFEEVSNLMAWVLNYDPNGVIKHEACYQIAARNMRQVIPDLINAALNDKSGLVKHESLESLGLMRAFEAMELISAALDDHNPDVKETAEFVLKRLTRLQKMGKDYVPAKIV